MNKFSMYVFLTAISCSFAFGAETFFLQTADSIKLDAGRTGVKSRISNVPDTALNRDVVKLHYELPADRKKATLDITFPELQKLQWQNIDSIKVNFKGGAGRIVVGIADRDGERFVYRKTTGLGAAEWSSHTSRYTDCSPNACHPSWAKNKSKINGIPDAPLKIAAMKLIITGDNVNTDLYLSSLEVDGKRFETVKE